MKSNMHDTEKTKKQLIEELSAMRDEMSRLKKLTNTHQIIVEQSTDSIIYTDLDFLIRYMNDATYDLYGWKFEEIEGKRPIIFNAESKKENYQQEIFDTLSTGNYFLKNFLNIRKDGSTFMCQLKISATFNEQGEVSGYMGTARDITEQDHLMQEVFASQQKYWAIMNQAHDAIVIADLQSGMLIDANLAAQKMTELSLDKLKQMQMKELHPKEAWEQHKIILQGLLEKGKAFEKKLVIVTKDGDHIPVEGSASVIEIEGQSLIQGVFRDISEQLKQQETLHLQRQVLESAANGIVITDAQGKILWNNPAFTKLTGYTQAEVKGKYPSIIKSGLTSEAVYKDLWDTILSGDAWTGRMINQRKDGTTYMDEQTITPVFNPDGEISHFFSIKHDVSKQIKAEEYLQRKLSELTLLQKISMAGASLMDEDEVIERMTTIISNTFYSDHLGVLLIRENGSVLIPHPSYMGINISDYAAEIPLGKGVAGQVAKTGTPQRIPDVSKIKNYIPSLENLKSELCVPLIVSGKTIGVINVESKTLDAFSEDDEQLLTTISSQMATAIERIRLYNELLQSNHELSKAYDHTLEGWARALELRDHETQGHTERVTQLAMRMAKKMGIEKNQLIHMQRGALLHDIGKIGIPDSILFKPAALDENEWEIMKRHPIYAFNIISRIPFLIPAIDIPYAHHERWNGTGYPRGLKGKKIPLSARIFTVADVWDALTTSRPYRAAWGTTEALEYIRGQSGKQFDPKVVKAFFEMLGE